MVLLWLGAWFRAFQPAQAGESPGAVILTNTAQIRALSPQEASRRLPVRLRGVFVAQINLVKNTFTIEDQIEGIYIMGPPALAGTFNRGDLVEVEGVTDPGGFAPFVVASAVRKIGQGEIPPPRHKGLGDMSDVGLDAQWVEVSGVVRSCGRLIERARPATPPPWVSASNALDGNEPRFKLTLASGGDRLAVEVNHDLIPEHYIDAEVRVRGICFSQHNTSRQFLNPLLEVPRDVELTIEKPPPADPFAGPAKPVASLLEFDRQSNFGHRVHVRGVVTHHRLGDLLWLRDGHRGLRVESAQNLPLNIGDEVEVAGFPARGPYSPLLEDAVYRKVAALPPPTPFPLQDTVAAVQHDADLVELEATLVEDRPIEDGQVMTLDWNGRRVEATLQNVGRDGASIHWLPGSRLRVAGICSVLTPKGGPMSGVWEPQSFQILMRATNDLALLAGPPWWTHQHIMSVLELAAGASLLAACVAMWMARLRLRERDNRRDMAEAEFGAILSERNRLAREIHDTLAQGLVATSVQLRLAKKQCTHPANGVAQYIDAAQQLVRESLEEARNSIWNMRAHILETSDLAGALEGILKQLSDGSGVQTRLEVTGKARRLAPVVENNLLRVGQEAITNATKHAQARNIAVNLEFAEKQFRLRVSDDGTGFNAAAPPPGGGGFGLVGIRERAAQLKGELDIRSAPGQGTRICLSVPLSFE